VIATPARVRTALVCALAVLFVGHVPAQTRFEVVHTFSSLTPELGAFPSSGPLAEAADGSLYGITDSGGDAGMGTVYRLADGVVTTVASFTEDTGLPAVATGLLLASDGNLYGTTEADAGGIGNGTVFRVTPDGTLSVWARFSFEDDGATPSGRLIEGLDGNLYGTALFGPGGGPGVVFRVGKAGETAGEGGAIEPFAIFELDPIDGSAPAGAFPTAGVTEVSPGIFYGTAEMGGANGHGTIFRATAGSVGATEGSVEAVHSFNNADGSMPASPLLLASDGTSTFLYGTTTGGGNSVDDVSGYPGAGTLFQIALDPDPAAASPLKTLASFDPAINGEFPYQQGVVQVGDYLYGTTQIGSPNGWGTIYRWSANAGLELVHALDGVTSQLPTNTLLKATDGELYGTGLGPEFGIIFSVAEDAEAQPSLEVTPATGTYGGSVTLSAALRSDAGDPIAGQEITFSLNGILVGPAMTGADGVASVLNVSIFGIDAGSYPGAIEASFAGSPGLLPATAVGTLAVEQATPSISIADATYPYDGLPHPAIGAVTGVGGEDLGPLTFTYNGAVAPPVQPGTYIVLASYAGSTNYLSASATALITILAPAPGVDGLIAAYGFDEGAGSIAGDASGKGHAGTISKADWTSAGRFGGALDFDGNGDWVTVDDAADLDIRDAITLEAWVNPRSLAGWNTILMKESANGLAYSLYANDFYPLHPAGYVNVGGADVSVVDSRALAVNAWSHVAMTYDGAMLRLYVNGDEVGRRALTGRIVATNKELRIGGNDVWGEFFSGRIDEVRIYGRALQPSEILRDMKTPIVNDGVAPVVSIASPTDGAVLSGMPAVTVSASDNLAISSVELQVNGADYGTTLTSAPFTFNLDLANGTVVLRAIARDVAGNVSMSAPVTITIANAAVADYRFNEGTGTAVLDSSGYNNNGTITGGVTRLVDGARGQVLSFNGSNGLVSIADAASLDLTTGMTLEAWVRPTSVDSWRTVVLKETDGGLSYSMYANDGDANKPAGYVRIGSSEEKVRAKKRLSSGVWVHIATTFDGTTMRFYVNGEEVESRKETGTIRTSDGTLRIGGNLVWGEWFRGQMDDVRIYNVAVGSAQIKADMK
jgi:uncharacterized repeat protein (TIGR03803 family)